MCGEKIEKADRLDRVQLATSICGLWSTYGCGSIPDASGGLAPRIYPRHPYLLSSKYVLLKVMPSLAPNSMKYPSRFSLRQKQHKQILNNSACALSILSTQYFTCQTQA